MDRRQRKLEKKRKERNLKKKAQAVARSGAAERLMRLAARSPLGPCAISADWDVEDQAPALVSVVVTRRLPDGSLVPVVTLVDRTCLGIKDSFVVRAMSSAEVEELFTQVGTPHGGMQECEALVAQSVIFHALEYARGLGFAPHPDFDEAMVGPRPAELVATPWHAPDMPYYMAGPNDDVPHIVRRLTEAVGEGNFVFIDPFDDETTDEELSPSTPG